MLVALLAVTAALLLPLIYQRNAGRERHRRAGLFTDCMGLFETCRVTQDGLHFPVLEGKFRGFEVRLEPVLDDMGLRKIPSLWLKATLRVTNPQRGVLDFLVRPQGIEFYSPSHDLPVRLAIPADWPQHAILCTDRATAVPDFLVLAPHMRAFADPKMKELLITPRGIRLVYQAAQAERGHYLVLRQSRFASERIDPALVRSLLNRVIAIAADLDGALARSAEKVA